MTTHFNDPNCNAESFDPTVGETVGDLSFRIEFAKGAPRSDARWEQRVNVLVAWLEDEWRRENAEGPNE